MNKKFSTLMAGFLLTSAFASATPDVSKLQKVTFDDGNVKAGTYFVVQECDGVTGLSAGDQILGAKFTSDAKNVLKYLAPVLSSANLTNYNEYSYDWDVEVVQGLGGKYYYALKNTETGVYLTFDATTKAIITDPAKSKVKDFKDGLTSLFERDLQSNQMINGVNWYAVGVSGSPNSLLFNNSDGNVELGSLAVNEGAIYLCEYAKQPADLAQMNKTIAGEGFGLSFDKIKDYESNVIAETKKFKAFEVPEIKKDMGNGVVHVIPAGTYLAVTYPQTVVANKISTYEEFQACTFLAVDPAKNKGINEMDKNAGFGYEFSIVSASSMNYVEDINKDQANIKGQVYVGNACFSINLLNYGAEVKDYKYEFLLKGFRYVNKDGKLVAKTGMAIGTVTSEGKSYIVTNSTAVSFSLINTSIYNPKGLLSTEDAPSIYTIQFVSGENKEEYSEYGQYLTVGATTSTQFGLYSTTDENVENDPLYQFVITDIDTTNKVATFMNRQTKVGFNAVLYAEEGKELTYTIYSEDAQNFNLAVISEEDNNIVKFRSEPIAAKQIKLSPVAVENKFATFNAADEINGLIRFELARTSESDAKFFVYVPRTKAGKIVTNTVNAANRLIATEEAVDLFELVKVKSGKKDRVEVVEIPYVYNRDGKKYTSLKRDTVAYNTYNVKLFAPEEQTEYYVDRNAAIVAATSSFTPQAFVVKTNLDGSVSLIPADNNVANMTVASDFSNKATTYFQVTAVEEKDHAWTSGYSYYLGDAINKVKTFMVGEPEAISLEAKPQHISVEAVRGGFLSMNADKDGILAIANEASEDLTLWVDTVKSGETVPSFYIAKGGNFMYFATDSLQSALVGKDKYELEDGKAKLIFKAAELVSSDTLKTVVDGKEVLVATKANAAKKIKGGLDNFQYQIIKDEEGSDEYVIRLTDKYQYVRVINNMLTLDADKKKAARFYIESQSAPTANEGVEVSEVTVIAGEGNVTIAGAAGKKVVISNILGQVVANTVISSDNATIAAPAGVVVVAVEGEAAVKAIVK